MLARFPRRTIDGRRGRITAGLLALTAALAAPAWSAASARADTSATFAPGAAWTDTAGNSLQLHSLGIIKVGSTWYGFGEDKAGESSSTAAFQDIPCYSSADLRTWTRQGTALARQSSGDLGVTSSVALFADYEAPAMAKIGGTYYLLASHLTGWGTNDNVYATATSLSGTWSSFKNFAPAGTHTYDTQTANIIP